MDYLPHKVAAVP